VKLSATCICGSDLWPYRGIAETKDPTPIGHEYCGIVEEVGRAVTSIRPGQFVIGSLFASDNTCPHCKAGGAINDRVDDAYRAKDASSPYLAPMIGERTRATTVKVMPCATREP
jgi:threonine dehydrogenase-like Zn-dependent dehydrogenase